MPTFEYTVDDESYSTDEHVLTAKQILELANIDPSTHYLVQLTGNDQKS